ncbi:MAG: NAD(P)-dependent oxidoreductase [Pseudomonadota bacterium]
MTRTVAMFEGVYPLIQDRLDALGLDIDVITFDADGRFGPDRLAPGEMRLDYLWFSSRQGKLGMKQPDAFAMALACRHVGVLQTYNAGLDDPFYARMAANGTRLSNSSAQGVAIAEYVIGQVMSVLQPIALQRQQQAAKRWRITPFREISQTNWLIVGFGPIGTAIAKRVKAFEAGVMAVRRDPVPDPNVDRMGTAADLVEMLAAADVVVLACPLNDATRGLAGPDFFAALKPGAILINIARGGVVDDAALLAALEKGTVETAILDVFGAEPLPEGDPYWTHPKVRLTPHTSFAGDGGTGRWDQLFLDNIARFMRGERLIREVDPGDL